MTDYLWIRKNDNACGAYSGYICSPRAMGYPKPDEINIYRIDRGAPVLVDPDEYSYQEMVEEVDGTKIFDSVIWINATGLACHANRTRLSLSGIANTLSWDRKSPLYRAVGNTIVEIPRSGYTRKVPSGARKWRTDL